MYTECDIEYNKMIRLTIQLTHDCNYNCYYCYDKGNRLMRKKETLKLQFIQMFLLNFKETINESFEISLLGGEPTLHPDFIKILEILSKCNLLKRLTIVTNGTASVNIYNTAYNLFGDKLRLNISIHLCNNISVDKYYEKIKKLNCKNIRINVLLDDKIDISIYLYVLEKFKEFSGLAVAPLYGVNYTQEFKKLLIINDDENKKIKLYDNKVLLREYTMSELTSFDYNPFEGLYCEAMLYLYNINIKGNIHKTCEYNNFISIVNKNKYKNMFSRNNICKLSTCNCGGHFKKYSHELKIKETNVF